MKKPEGIALYKTTKDLRTRGGVYASKIGKVLFQLFGSWDGRGTGATEQKEYWFLRLGTAPMKAFDWDEKTVEAKSGGTTLKLRLGYRKNGDASSRDEEQGASPSH